MVIANTSLQDSDYNGDFLKQQSQEEILGPYKKSLEGVLNENAHLGKS